MNNEETVDYYGLEDSSPVLEEGVELLSRAVGVMEKRGATKEALKIFEAKPLSVEECQRKLLLASEFIEKLQPNEASTIIDVNDGLNISNESMELIKRSAEDFIKKTEDVANKAEVSSVAGLESIKVQAEIVKSIDNFYRDYDTSDWDMASKRDQEAFKKFLDLIKSEHTISDIKNIAITGGMELRSFDNAKFEKLCQLADIK